MKKRFNTEFYHAIDKLCVNKGITHKRLAEITGIQVRRIETGMGKRELNDNTD